MKVIGRNLLHLLRNWFYCYSNRKQIVKISTASCAKLFGIKKYDNISKGSESHSKDNLEPHAALRAAVENHCSRVTGRQEKELDIQIVWFNNASYARNSTLFHKKLTVFDLTKQAKIFRVLLRTKRQSVYAQDGISNGSNLRYRIFLNFY